MKLKQIIAIFLSVVLLLSCTTFVPATASQESKAIELVPELDTIAEQTPVPETIASIICEENNHVERLHSEEGGNLNALVFQNEDGTKTMYIYDHPVKYRDDQGFVQDISLAIADSDNPSYPFRTQANSVVTEFPAVLSDGIVLSDNDVTLRLVAPPAEGNVALNHKARRLNTQTIAYTYDVKTTIEYGLTYTGFKEDIVVNEYTGQTEYPFILYTNGLELTTIDDSYYLIDDAGDIKAAIGDIIVFTADERNNTYGTLQATTIKPGEIYALTIVLDAGYLSDPNTAYPIRIDPTIELVYTEDTPNAIEEKTLQSNNTTSGSNTATVIGKNAKGISRTIMKFPGINFTTLNGVTVISAVATLRDLMCESEEMTITCYPFTGGAWTEDNAQWANLTQSWGEALDYNVVSYANGRQQATAHRYSFDITELAQKWMDGTADYNLGIIFRSPDTVENGTDYFYKTFATSERASYKPTFTITYRDVAVIDQQNVNLPKGNSVTLSVSSVLGITGVVTWRSTNENIATVNTNGVVTGAKVGQTTIIATVFDRDGNEHNPECKVYVTLADGMYYIKNAASNLCLQTTDDNTRIYTQNTNQSTRISQLWKITHTSNGYYLIQPMCDLSTALTVNSQSYVDVVDADIISDTMKWKITQNDYGYVFTQYDNDNKAIIPVTPYVSGTLLYPGAWNDTSPTCHWSIDEAKGVFIRDKYTLKTTIASTTRYIEVGETCSLSALGLLYEEYGTVSDGPAWTSLNTNIVTISDSTSGSIYGKSAGECTIQLSAKISTVTYTQEYKIHVETLHVHAHEIAVSLSITHPHKTIWVCECGDSYETYSLNTTCQSCLANAKTVTVTTTEIHTFLFTAGDIQDVPVPASVECIVVYTNTYSYPSSDFSSAAYGYPLFASFSSSVVSEYRYSSDSSFPGLTLDASLTVEYYSSAGELLGSQDMSWFPGSSGNSRPSNMSLVYTLDAIPAYATTYVMFAMWDALPSAKQVTITATFS